MTNRFNIISIIIAVIMVGLIVTSTAYIGKLNSKNSATIMEYENKKQEIISRQKQIESMIENLNKNLSYEISRQNSISAKVEEISGQKIVVSGNQSNLTSAPAPPATQTTTPIRTRVTRAS